MALARPACGASKRTGTDLRWLDRAFALPRRFPLQSPCRLARTANEYAGKLCGVSTPSYVETINQPDSLGTCLTQNHPTSSHQHESRIVDPCQH